MTNPIQALLLMTGLEASQFPPNSRYHGIPFATAEIGGIPVVYLKRRFLPPAASFATLRHHVVSQGERIDNITAEAREIGDPERFWLLCDANNAMDPLELETLHRRLRITLPQGVAGTAG